MKYKGKCGGMSEAQWEERWAWCLQTFGPMSHSRWWAKPIFEIRFEHEEDYMMYCLRWG